MANGRIAEPGALIRHLCDNKGCCNPAHLLEGDRQQNAADFAKRQALIASGHVGPTPVPSPVTPPSEGWHIDDGDVDEAYASFQLARVRALTVTDENGCWIWQAQAQHDFGYGQISGMNSHRFAFKWAHGNIPTNAWILHRCGVAACCNPDHLYAGSPTENAADTGRHGRRHTGVKHHNAKFSNAQVEQIRIDYWDSNLSLEDTAKKHAGTLGSVSRILKGEAYADAPGPREARLRGARDRVLSRKLAEEVRLRARSGETVTQIARDLNINVETLRDAINGKSWKHR